MFSQLINRLRGVERLKTRGDQFFLSGEFGRASAEYERARSILSRADYRLATIDALIGECRARISPERRETKTFQPTETPPGHEIVSESASWGGLEDGGSLVPELDEFFALAIEDKTDARAALYRRQGAAFRAGYVALVQGDAERAIDGLQRALSRRQDDFLPHLELGRALSLAERMQEAEAALESAYDLRPDDVETRLLLAAVQIERGVYHSALKHLQSLRNEGESGPEFTFLYGKALNGVGRSDDALQAFRETVRQEPNFHEAFYEGGRLLVAAGDVEAGFQLLQRACSLAPDEVFYNRSLGELVLEHELDAETGLSAADRLMVTDESNQWEYLSWIAEFYVRRGWKREARDPLRRAISLVPPELGRQRVALEQRLIELDA